MRFLWFLMLAPPLAAQGLDFAVARYASRSAHTLYAGYRVGTGLVFAGVLQNPRTAYREAMVGVGRPVGPVTIGVAVATTSDGDYLQLYLMPDVARGPVAFDATISAQRRFTGDAVEVSVAPANVLVRLAGAWSVGASWTLGATLGVGATQALGPAVTLAVPGGRLGLHLLHGVGARADEVWLSARIGR